jgi:hypothetical protein
MHKEMIKSRREVSIMGFNQSKEKNWKEGIKQQDKM